MKAVKPAIASMRAAATLGTGFAATTTPAHALECGYSEVQEKYNSSLAISLPWVGTVNPFGGTRMVAHWGNCGDQNQTIRIDIKNGPKDLCVTPGDTRLRFSRNDQKVTGAVKLGGC